MAIVVKCPLSYGQIVYVKTDTHQDPRQVIGVMGTADGGILIKLTADGEAGWFYECEITVERNILMVTDN